MQPDPTQSTRNETRRGLFDEIWAVVTAKDKRASARRLAIILPAILAEFVASGYYGVRSIEVWNHDKTARGLPLDLCWALIAGGMIVFLVFLGWHVHGRTGGALIDQRKLMSLSRFQLVSWTVLITSAFLTFALVRIFADLDDPLEIAIPTQVWQLLGISVASTIGRGLVMSSKKTRQVPNAGVLAKETAAALNATASDDTPREKTTPEEIEKYRQGSVYCNPSAADASVADMFQGDEVGNTANIDMSKVQMFFFTIAALVAYAASVYKMLGHSPDELSSLPEVTPGLVTILGISHTAYLGNKALDHSTTVVSAAASDDLTT